MTTTETLRPCRWTFDGEKTYDGLTDDSTWNGFLNVWVTPEVHEQVLADSRAEGVDENYMRDQCEQEPGEEPDLGLFGLKPSTGTVGGSEPSAMLYCYGWGFTAQEVTPEDEEEVAEDDAR